MPVHYHPLRSMLPLAFCWYVLLCVAVIQPVVSWTAGRSSITSALQHRQQQEYPVSRQLHWNGERRLSTGSPFHQATFLASSPQGNDFWEDGETTIDSGDSNAITDEEAEALLGDWDERVPKFNTVHLVGRAGGDPVAKYFDDGKVVVSLSMANQRKYHGLERQELGLKSGDEETDWYGLEIWGRKGEFVAKYVTKGARIGVIGSLKIDNWVDKATGEPRCRPKIIVREFDILESRAEAELRKGRSPSDGSHNNGYNRASNNNYNNRRGGPPNSYPVDDEDDDSDDSYGPGSNRAGGFFD